MDNSIKIKSLGYDQEFITNLSEDSLIIFRSIKEDKIFQTLLKGIKEKDELIKLKEELRFLRKLDSISGLRLETGSLSSSIGSVESNVKEMRVDENNDDFREHEKRRVDMKMKMKKRMKNMKS